MTMTLGEACTHIVDCEHKTSPIDETGEYFAVGTPAMRGNVIDYAEARRISKETFVAWTRRLTPKFGDLLFAREAPVGPIVSIPRAENVAPGQRTVLLRPNGNVVDSTYLYYLLSSPLEQARIASTASGSTVAHLNVADVRSFELPRLPSLAEQRAIAEVLGALDDKIAANARVCQVVTELADALFDKGVTDADTRRSLGELVAEGSLTLGDGYRTKKGEHGQPGLRILRAGDIQDGQIVAAGSDFVSSDYRRQMGAKASQPGDILLTTKGTVGRVAVYPDTIEQMVYSPQLCFFRPVPGGSVGGAFLATWFRTKDFERQAATVMYKSDMAPYISLADIRTMSVPLLLPEAQARLEARLSGLIELIAAKAHESGGLADLRDVLLRQLMSGKIRVRDAERVVEEVV